MGTDVSIVVPVYNDSEGIQRTLQSLVPFRSNPVLHEIAVIDNASTDNTPEVIQEFSDEYENVEYLREMDVQSSYAARNKGIRNTSGDVLAFVDADMKVSPDWLPLAFRSIKENNANYLGCNVKLELPNNPSLAGQFDHVTGFPVQEYITTQGFAPTCCLFVKRSIFEDVGLFDSRLTSGGDKEFGNRVQSAGYDMYYEKDVIVYHPVRNSIRELIRKDLRVGRGLCQLQRLHSDRYGTPGFPPMPSGIKSPKSDLSSEDRILLGLLSMLLTGVRAIGYYHEFLTGNSKGDMEDQIASLQIDNDE